MQAESRYCQTMVLCIVMQDEERLLQTESGLKLPVKGMQYWVRGITSPQYKVDQLILDNAGRPQTLYQAGWKVSYSVIVTMVLMQLRRRFFSLEVKTRFI